MRITDGSYSRLLLVIALSLSGSNRVCYGRRFDAFHQLRRLFKLRGGEESKNPPPPDHYHSSIHNHHQHYQDSYNSQQQQQHPQQHSNSDVPPVPNFPDDDGAASRQPPPHQQHQNYQQQQQQYSNDDYHQHSMHESSYQPRQQDPYQQQQQQQQGPPPLPPGAFGDNGFGADGPPPLPGGGYGNSHLSMEPDLPPHDDASLFRDVDDTVSSSGGFPTEGLHQQADASGMDLSSFDKEYILNGLAKLYRKKILPLEIASRYGHFHSEPLSPADFVAPPLVLLLGQYSVGKTSFIKYLAGRDFPGIRVGPEPTTDRFTAVLWGPNDKIVPGAALCSQTNRPFTGLSPFGNNFLSRLEGVELDVPILRNITLVDTPGILSGQKQRSRNYEYESVMKWFGERADLVIVMFDAHKLDISDELKRVMELFIPHLDKIRIVLNKADSISTQQLMRVYGALMWSLGKVMNTPEVCRVYMGSFWDAPLQNIEQAELLQREEIDLLNDIMNLPQQAVMRRINELVKRARSVKVHAYLIHYLRKQLPYTWGKKEKQRRLIGRLESEMNAAARRYGLPKGDFPPLEPFRRALLEIKDLSEYPKLDKKMVREMDKVFSVDIPDLLEKARLHENRENKGR